MNDKIKIGKKGLESGYVYAPYIIQTSNPVIIDIEGKNKIRMQKISNIFNLGLYIESFSPNKSISSRYATRKINSKYYKII
jgi:hypothetical protein